MSNRRGGTAVDTAVPADLAPNRLPVAGVAGRAERAVGLLSFRLIRRGALLLTLAVVAYVSAEVLGYVHAYPDAASRARLAALADNPAVRMLQGVPHAVTTPGGYFAWDGGWVLEALVGVWALLVTSRLLRGEEEAGRTDLLLAGPIPAARAVAVPLIIVDAAAGVIGAAVLMTLILTGTGAAGSVLFSVGLVGFAATCAGIAAVTAQAFPVRRRAVGVAGMVFGGLFLLRMAGNGDPAWGWLRWLTPFGWIDELHAYGDNRWLTLTPLLLAPALLGGAAVRMRGARDTGAGLLAANDRREPNLRLLASPTGFAWRSTRGVLLAWLAGLAAYAFVAGCLVKTVTDFLAQDQTYRDTMEAMGLDAAQTARGYIAVMSGLLGFLFVLYTAWRIDAARAEEAAARLDLILVRPIPRWRWLGGHAVLTMAAAGLLSMTSGTAIWIGAFATGADVSLPDALAATVNTLPVVVLFAGLAIATFALIPRFTVGLPVGVAVLTYVLGMLGPALNWPVWLLNISPFTHLALVPAEQLAVVPAGLMLAAGFAATIAGLAAFERRDITDHQG